MTPFVPLQELNHGTAASSRPMECPKCRATRQWHMHWEPATEEVPGRTVPEHLAVICGNCGYTFAMMTGDRF